MLRSVNTASLERHCRNTTRPYQIALVALSLFFVGYVLHTENRMAAREVAESDSIGGGLPGAPGSKMRVYSPADFGGKASTCPPCECHCYNADGSVSNSRGAGSKALTVSAGAGSDSGKGWRLPYTDRQWYNPTPAILGNGIRTGDYHQIVRAAYPPVGPEKGSLWDASYLNTPIAYGTYHVPEKENDGFPTGFMPRPACQHDTDVLQNYLYANQHPKDCKKAKLLVRRHMPGYGLFAGLGLSSNYLFLASVLGRTLIDLSPNTYFTGNCDSNDLRCAFLPLTSCTAADFSDHEICYDHDCFETARVISIDRMSLTDYLPCAPTAHPIGRCNQSGGPKITTTIGEILGERLGRSEKMDPADYNKLHEAHGELWFQQEYSRYLTRPNERLTAFAEETMRELGITQDTISVHIRHGDKTEGIQFPTQAYGLVVKRAIQITGIKTVFIGSDDTSVYKDLPQFVNLEGVTYKYMDYTKNPIVFSAAEAGRKGANTMGLSLMTQTIIFMQSAVFIGTRSSNAGQIVFSMQGNDCTRKKIDFDMYGDMFYNSWYCRSDIEHAGREWMCALERPNEGSFIWKFGGARTQC